MTILLAVVGIVFLFGLIQWARSGAVLWDIHEILKHRHGVSPAATEKERQSEKEALQKSIKHLETTMDGFLRSSFKILGALALCVWVFVVFTVVVDMLGLNWLDRMGYFSSNRITGNPSVRSAPGRFTPSNTANRGSGGRGSVLQSGNPFRR
jgi:xanthine/uracil/vitamin C permease (AzgA family)